ncbi:MAG: hypothetical protein AAF614_08145 [Chloroflexota bacterium]
MIRPKLQEALMLNYVEIVEKLDEGIETAVWQSQTPFDYRQVSRATDTATSSYIASVQQFHFSGMFPASFQSKQHFFNGLGKLEPQTIFEIDSLPNWVEMRIFNFYPTAFRQVASLFGATSHITLYLMLHSATIHEIAAQSSGRGTLWGYELMQKRGLPKLFQSGPGLFEFTVQLFRADPHNKLLTLYFLAAERPQAVMALFGRDWFFPPIKRLSQSPSRFAPFANRLVMLAENEMLRIHNRVHLELIDALCLVENQ